MLQIRMSKIEYKNNFLDMICTCIVMSSVFAWEVCSGVYDPTSRGQSVLNNTLWVERLTPLKHAYAKEWNRNSQNNL